MPAPLIDRVRAALRKTVSGVPQLAAALEDARKVEAEATAAVERQAAAVAAGFLDDASKRQAERTKLADLRAEAEDAEAVRREAERRHAAAVAADAEAARSAAYDSARAKSDAAARNLAASYPRLVAGLLGVLKETAEAQAAVAAVNSDLPAGAAPLDDPERAARGVAGLPREVISDTVVEAWSRLDQDRPVEPHHAAAIYAVGDGGWGKHPDDVEPVYRKRRFRRVEIREAVPAPWTASLAASLRLPALRGDGYLWGSAPAFGFDPVAAAAVKGDGEPGAVLARVAEVEAAAAAKPIRPERVVKVEWTLLGEVVPFPAPVPLDTTRARSPAAGSRFGATPFAAPGTRTGGR